MTDTEPYALNSMAGIRQIKALLKAPPSNTARQELLSRLQNSDADTLLHQTVAFKNAQLPLWSTLCLSSNPLFWAKTLHEANLPKLLKAANHKNAYLVYCLNENEIFELIEQAPSPVMALFSIQLLTGEMSNWTVGSGTYSAVLGRMAAQQMIDPYTCATQAFQLECVLRNQPVEYFVSNADIQKWPMDPILDGTLPIEMIKPWLYGICSGSPEWAIEMISFTSIAGIEADLMSESIRKLPLEIRKEILGALIDWSVENQKELNASKAFEFLIEDWKNYQDDKPEDFVHPDYLDFFEFVLEKSGGYEHFLNNNPHALDELNSIPIGIKFLIKKEYELLNNDVKKIPITKTTHGL